MKFYLILILTKYKAQGRGLLYGFVLAWERARTDGLGTMKER